MSSLRKFGIIAVLFSFNLTSLRADLGLKTIKCLDYLANQREYNKWSMPTPCAKGRLNTPQRRTDSLVAPYTRGPEFVPQWQKDKHGRMVMFGGRKTFALSNTVYPTDTWLYCTYINSWNLLPLSAQHPSARSNHTMTTLCDTKVILFGGYFETLYNDTWLFDGVSETWHQQNVSVLTEGAFVTPRRLHTAVTIRQPLSNCTCQESMLLYGGIHEGLCLGDLWEMRCLRDSNGNERFYWILLGDDDTTSNNWPRLRFDQNAADFNKNLLYMWGGKRCLDNHATENMDMYYETWEYNLTGNRWRLVLNGSNLLLHFYSYHNRTFVSNSVYYSKLRGIVTVIQTATTGYIVLLHHSGESLVASRIGGTDKGNEDPNVVENANLIASGGTLYIVQFSKSDIGSRWTQSVVSVSQIWYSTKLSSWTWFRLPHPQEASLTTPSLTVAVGQTFLAVSREIAFYVNGSLLGGLIVWKFNLINQIWFEEWYPFGPDPSCFGTTTSVMNSSMLVIYQPKPCRLSSQENTLLQLNSTALWVYNTSVWRWTACLELPDQPRLPIPRYGSTIADMGNGSLLMFGGETEKGMLNDLWRVDMCSQDKYMPVVEDCLRWVLLSGNTSNPSHPSPRHSHSSFVSENDLFVFGGTSGSLLYSNTSNYTTLTDTWKLNLESRVWVHVKTKGPVQSLPCSMAQTGRKVITVGKRAGAFDASNQYDKKYGYVCRDGLANGTFVFDTNLATWDRIADSQPHPTINNRLMRSMALSYFNGIIVTVRPFFDYQMGGSHLFCFLHVSCPFHFVSNKWGNDSCKRCPVGTYALMGATHCSHCSEGLTTNGSAETQADCICRDDYCFHGQCVIVAVGSGLRAACRCSLGYTGSLCKYPTYYLVGVGIFGVMFLLFMLILFVKRMRKYKRAKRDVEEELSSAKSVWTIQHFEVRLGARIDGDTPGSYGEVYRAEYRDMTVAVKYLNIVMFADPNAKKEFEREMEFMRTIRHPNIVMFFGAGRQTDSYGLQYPFIVIEYMVRGTLKKILDSPEVPICHKRRVSFALDGAKGMQYLHALSPPRIHRDMKSTNLLVSRTWVVKVSDFGSARLVKREGECQPTSVALTNENRPLLSADHLMTRDMGTLLWRAPEIFALKRYGTSVDVYR